MLSSSIAKNCHFVHEVIDKGSSLSQAVHSNAKTQMKLLLGTQVMQTFDRHFFGDFAISLQFIGPAIRAGLAELAELAELEEVIDH